MFAIISDTWNISVSGAASKITKRLLVQCFFAISLQSSEENCREAVSQEPKSAKLMQ